jgi:RimJ/RimL family protein N-acetyltransferase
MDTPAALRASRPDCEIIMPGTTEHTEPRAAREVPAPSAASSRFRWGAELPLLDGSTVHVRPIRPDDTEQLRAFHSHLSADTIIMRFFHLMPDLPRTMAEHFTHVDYVNRMALVATQVDAEGERFVGVVRYDRIGPTEAEVAFVVDDHWQGYGIATALLLRLACHARQQGFKTLVAITMGTNRKMLDVLRHCGFPCTCRVVDSEVECTLDITAPSALDTHWLDSAAAQN